MTPLQYFYFFRTCISIAPLARAYSMHHRFFPSNASPKCSHKPHKSSKNKWISQLQKSKLG
jgi:hypothetical protein